MHARRLNPLPPHLQHQPTPDDSTGPVYVTGSVPVAAALIAANILDFSHAQLATEGAKVELIFFDPYQIGEDLSRQYYQGTFPTVSPRFFSEIRGCLAQEVNRLLRASGVDRENH